MRGSGAIFAQGARMPRPFLPRPFFPQPSLPTRRRFLAQAATATAGLYSLNLAAPASAAQATDSKSDPKPKPDPDLLVIAPRPGYTPQIGILIAELDYLRHALLGFVKGMSQKDLDYLIDPGANTIGALLLHLSATETYYGMNTFENKKWDSWSDDIKKKWDPAMNLGDAGRKEIKGHDLDFYLNALHESRERNLAEFKKRDDKWLLGFDTEQFGKEKVNVYWKWFHVAEHESHHAGQIGFLAKRLPGAKPSAD
jgi:uncharacterized damage-inducible protein DinB